MAKELADVPTTMSPKQAKAPTATESFTRKIVTGVPIAAVTMPEMVSLCADSVRNKRQMTIGAANAAKVVKMRHDPQLCQAVLGTDIIIADGASLVLASRLLGQSLPCRVTGIDLFFELLKVADQEGFSVFFFGATQEVLDAVLAKVRLDHPHLPIAGSRNGYYKPEEEAAITEEIRASQADLLFVAMGSPAKELFLARWGKETGARICHGVGGSFDVMGGKVKRAPMMMQNFGLEWLYRVWQEPRRMWKRYLVTNSAFAFLVLRTGLARLFGRKDAVLVSSVGDSKS